MRSQCVCVCSLACVYCRRWSFKSFPLNSLLFGLLRCYICLYLLLVWQPYHTRTQTVEYVDEWFGRCLSFRVRRLPLQTLNRFRKWFDNIPFYGLNIVLIVMLMMVDGGSSNGSVVWRPTNTENGIMFKLECHEKLFVYFSRISVCVCLFVCRQRRRWRQR